MNGWKGVGSCGIVVSQRWAGGAVLKHFGSFVSEH